MAKIMDWFRFLFGGGQTIEIVENDGEDAPVDIVDPVDEPEDVDEGEGPEIIIPVAPEPDRKWKYAFLLDNGHAASTPGKRSPKESNGKQFFEYEFNRDIVKRLSVKLDEMRIPHEIIVPETEVDVPLSVRAARANALCDKYGRDRTILISVHANAAGKGDKWMTAKGWCCYTSKGETASDTYAEMFMREAEKVLAPMGFIIRKYSQKKYSWEENYTILVKTVCPAILTENLFYDNRDEVRFLQSEIGREAITQIHFNTIMQIENLG